jgi:hypothetical protein
MFLLTAVRLPLFPQLLLPFPFLRPSFPSSPSLFLHLFLRYAQLDQKSLLLRPSFSLTMKNIDSRSCPFDSFYTWFIVTYSRFFCAKFRQDGEIWKCCADLSKGSFFGKFPKKFARKVGEKGWVHQVWLSGFRVHQKKKKSYKKTLLLMCY